MRVHEGVAVLPRVGHLFEEGHAVLHLAARFEAMGDGVVRPGIAAVQGDRLACRVLELGELLLALVLRAGDDAPLRFVRFAVLIYY